MISDPLDVIDLGCVGCAARLAAAGKRLQECHALLDRDTPEVNEYDVLFMIRACAAFVSYLLGKARNAGLLSAADTSGAQRS
jgi:hypothetical protein